MKLEGKILGNKFKLTWTQENECFKKGSEENRLEQYSKKEMQSEIYKTISAIYGWRCGMLARKQYRKEETGK